MMRFKVLVLVLMLLGLTSCNQASKSKTNISLSYINESIDSVYSNYSSRLHESVDSIVLDYWAPDAFVYIFNYSKGEMNITRTIAKTSSNSSITRHVSDDAINGLFLSYIDAFFISKKETVEYNRLRSSDTVITDYPWLEFEIMLNNKQIIKDTVRIGEEGYDITYNPQFLAFFDLINNLVSTL